MATPVLKFWSFTADPKEPPKWAAHLVLAQGDDGEFYLPSKKRADWWDRRFNPRFPAHWPYALVSFLSRRMLMIEMDYSAGTGQPGDLTEGNQP